MGKQYDLEQRAEVFAVRVRDFVKNMPKDLTNLE